VQWVLESLSVGLLLLRNRLLPNLSLDTLVGCLSHLGCSDSRRYFRDIGAMAPLVLPGRFVVVQRSLDAERLSSSTRLVRVVQVVLVEYGSFVIPDIVRPSTKVCTTRC
jgi:hypothetical protein